MPLVLCDGETYDIDSQNELPELFPEVNFCEKGVAIPNAVVHTRDLIEIALVISHSGKTAAIVANPSNIVRMNTLAPYLVWMDGGDRKAYQSAAFKDDLAYFPYSLAEVYSWVDDVVPPGINIESHHLYTRDGHKVELEIPTMQNDLLSLVDRTLIAEVPEIIVPNLIDGGQTELLIGRPLNTAKNGS